MLRVALAAWWCYTAGVKSVGSETCTEGVALFCISVDPEGWGEQKFSQPSGFRAMYTTGADP